VKAPATHLQLFSGREEQILEPDLPIIDSHHHLFVRPPLSYMADDYLADAGAGHRIVASVYVETQAFMRMDGDPMLRPLGEVEFANGIGAGVASRGQGDCRLCAGIIGHADLRFGDAIAELLDRALELAPHRFKGVRQITMEHPDDAPFRYMPQRPPTGVLEHPKFRAGFRQVASRGLSFDAAVFHHQMRDIGALADEFPDAAIIINHMGIASVVGINDADRRQVFREWSDALRALARRPNVSCKVGGLGMPFWGFDFHERQGPIGYRELSFAWKPYVETAIDAFGPNRCMFESNYPPDARSAGFVPLWNAMKCIVQGYSSADKAALFHDTALRVYRLT
jgi:L-fuconolactonase